MQSKVTIQPIQYVRVHLTLGLGVLVIGLLGGGGSVVVG